MSNEPENPIGEHPRGTLAILLIYGALFALGWAAFYFGVFLPRGPVGS